MMTTTNAPVAATSQMLAGARICSEPGCKKILGPTNHSGKCSEHRPHRSNSNGNGAVAAKPNGHAGRVFCGNQKHALAGKTNGLDRQIVIDRVKILCTDKDLVRSILDAIPAEDKAVMVANWLEGRI